MEEFRSLLLSVWREACRHIEIAESTATIAGLLADRLPIQGVSVLALDLPKGRLVLRAVGPGRTEAPSSQEGHALTSSEMESLLSWASEGGGRLLRGDAPDDLDRLLLPAGATGSWLVGPLRGERGPSGVLRLQARSEVEFLAEHRRMLDDLLEPFSAALENDRRLHELAALREAAEADKRSALMRLGREDLQDVVVGAESGLHPVLERVRLVARSDIPVLLLGETGTGKELIARSIHDSSARARGPFIRVNCGAIAPELIDSELFGHERGAFTGATSSKRGWFERADRGTLLLDEVGELPLPAQVRFLRVLQEGSFERVGGEKAVHVDVRIVAATHRDLPAMVQNGQFREDLWYRIAGFPIVLPPLRERKADIRDLAEHFAERAARRFGLRQVHLGRGDVELLRAYDWPGNVRELASVIDRAVILGEGETLELVKALGAATPVAPAATGAAAAAAVRAAGVPNATAEPALESLDAAMRRHIEAALGACHGRVEGVAGAATLLGINPHTLRARMRKLGIEWNRFRG